MPKAIAALCAGLALFAGSNAVAQETGTDLPLIALSEPQVSQAQPLVDLPLIEMGQDVQAASDAMLAELAGGQTNITALTDQDLTAVNSGNQINAGTVGSGSIALGPDALSGFAGVGNFVMNTGHNNNLQSTLSVTIIVTE